MEKVMKLHYPEYSYRVEVIVTNNIQKSQEARRDKLTLYEGAEPLGLFSYDAKDEFEPIGFIFLKPDSNVDTITHEVVHMVKRIFDRVGSVLDDSSEELFAYNVGYASGKIHKFVKKQKKQK